METRRAGVISLLDIYWVLLVVYLCMSFLMLTSAMTVYVGYILIAVGAVVVLFSRTKILRSQAFISACLVFYCIFVFLSRSMSAESIADTTTKGRLIQTICNSLIMLLTMTLLQNFEEKKWDRIFYLLIIAGIFGTLANYSWAELMQGFQGITRLGGKLNGINSYGMFMSFLGIFAFYKFYTVRKYKLLNGTLFLLMLFFSATSGSRKAMIGCVIGAFLIMVLSVQKGKLFTFLRIALVLLVVYYILSSFDIMGGVWDRISTIWDNSNAVVDQSDETRSLMIAAALQGWLKSPIVGHGFNTFTQMNIFRTYSHCNYAEILFNTGLVGLVLYYAPKIYILVSFIKNNKEWNDGFAKFLMCLMSILLLYDIACISYYDVLLNYIWWISAALLIEKQWISAYEN